MALTKTIVVPQTGEPSQAYQVIDLFQLRFGNTQAFRMDTLDYASKAAFESGVAIPLGATTFLLPKEGLPALDDHKRPLHKREDGTYVLREEKDKLDALAIVPKWKEVPPMLEYVMSVVTPPGGVPEGVPIFNLLLKEMYSLLASRPEFEGATVVDV